MAKPYSVNIAFGSLTAGQTSTPISPPAGTIWVIRTIDFRGTGGTAVNLFVQFVPQNIVVITVPDPTGNLSGHYDGHVVVPAGQQITFTAQGAPGNYCCSGYQLSTT
jgi:hypothetical protein